MKLMWNMKLFDSYPQSQAHCLVAPAITQPKPAKELALPKHEQEDMDKARNANN